MDTLSPFVTTFVSSLIPGDNINLKLQSGILAGELCRQAIKRFATIPSWMNWFHKNHRYLYISQFLPDGHANPVFLQLEEYIIAKHFDTLQSAQLIPKKGEITLFPKKGLRLVEKYENETLEIALNSTPSDDISTDTGNAEVKITSNSSGQIVISSKKHKLEQLKEYVKQICKLDRVLHSTITVYRALTHKGKKDDNGYVEWDKLFMKTNKTVENTIYSDKVLKDLFQDVEWFMNNESWFVKRGVPYKRGYLLHGSPGTGKTSISKILANKYHLPIFVVDLQTITDNSDFTKLITEINYLTDKRYIISIEDIDRCNMFKDRYYDECGKKLSIQCFMNFLDGIVETHGRICIFSANDISMLDTHPAIFRPGRIDCQVEITYCDKKQISKLFQLFYDKELSEENIQVSENLTPAQLVNLMSKTSCESTEQYLKSNGKKSNSEEDGDMDLPAIQSLLGTGAFESKKNKSGMNNYRSRSRRNRRNDPVRKLKENQKKLESMEKLIIKSMEKSEKIRDEIKNRTQILEEKKLAMETKKQELLEKAKSKKTTKKIIKRKAPDTNSSTRSSKRLKTQTDLPCPPLPRSDQNIINENKVLSNPIMVDQEIVNENKVLSNPIMVDQEIVNSGPRSRTTRSAVKRKR